MYKFFIKFLFFLLFFVPSISFATQVRIPDSYFFTSSGGPFVVYDNLTGEFIGGGTEYYEGYELNSEFFGYISSEYKIVEMSSQNVCQNSFLNYTDCIGSPYFIQIVDTINLYLPLSDGGGGGGGGDPILDEELAPAGGHSVASYSPEVNIFSILKGSIFSDNLIVDYKVTDGNDNGNERNTLGLKDNPVSIFYSDKINNWYENFLGSDNKIEIAKDQPKEGKYEWSVKDLIPNILYRIIVEATDLAGSWGQSVSEYFSVDFTEPVFTVKVDPPAVRSGEVTISIDSSEDLSEIPEVKVTQNEGTASLVVMKGEKSHYEGVYKVISGYDGTATIKVVGYDLASNKGEVLVSGGTFSVGMNPPPKPKIDNYKEKIVTKEGFLDVSGSVRSDTEVILSVNGVEISKIKPDEKGNFIFNKIVLDKKKNKGINYINISSKDPLGSISEAVLIEVKYNIAPTVKIIKPITKEIISNIIPIAVDGKDENSDVLYYKYQVISQSDFNNKINNWLTLSENNPSSIFSWNTTEVEDGNYLIKVVTTDGNTEATSEIVSISVKNVLPYFRFENGRNTITNQSKVELKGKALTSTNITPRPSITSVAYSMDGGITWTPVKVIDDGSPSQKKFSVVFSDLKEGNHAILWRTKDSRGFIGKMVHSIVIDKTIPKSPTIKIPKLVSNEIIINDANDEDPDKIGMQINITGVTEALNTVNLSHDGKILTTKALPTGSFSFRGVTFDKKGKYDMKISTTDLALNKSDATSFFIVYNNPPVISFLSPRAFRGISKKSNISWSIKDLDGDVIKDVNISYRNKNKDILYRDLVVNGSTTGSYNWDTTNLPESNNYELKISASDPYSSISGSIIFTIDHTSPIVTSFNFDKNQMNQESKKLSFVSTGSSSDNLSGIEFIEYKIEEADNKVSPWYKGLITNGIFKNKANFIVKHPVISSDGDYKVYARAVDSSGNVSEPLSLSLTVDKNAPRVGGFFIEKSGTDLIPDENGKISIYKNSIFSFSISLEEDTESASLEIGGKTFILEKDIKSQLWKTDISLNTDKEEKLSITAKDHSLNVVDSKEIGTIEPLSRGVISFINKDGMKSLIAGASINVLKLNENTNQFEDYIDNRIVSNQSGEYDLVLPQGEYRFIVTGTAISTLKYQYSINRPSIININFDVKPVSGWMRFINNFMEIFK